MKERMNGDFELLEKAIDSLREHSVMVGSIVLAKSSDHRGRISPPRELTQEEKKPLRDTLALLLEIRNNERRREQDEHAIAFAELHKDSADPDTRRMSRDILAKTGDGE